MYVAQPAVVPYHWLAWTSPALGHTLRGIGRLLLAITFTALFAANLPLPWNIPF